MEELLSQLNSTSFTSVGISDTGYSSLFKNWGRQGKQEDRRKELLENQKRERNGCIDKSRGILEVVDAVEMEMDWSGANLTGYKPSVYTPGFHRHRPTFRDKLMLSEWMIEKPDDLDSNWYMVMCPKGKRCLVVAHRGRTKVFNKMGAFMFEFHSMLPGGSPGSRGSRSNSASSVLDCVHCEKTGIIYVLDLLAWNNQSMCDCDTEFRHYWLYTQFEESSLLRVVTKKNEMRFELLPKLLCTTENLQKVMSDFPPFPDNVPALDGILFYHRETSYTAGKTPLVGWLFPFMVDELLCPGLPVHESYREMKPLDYTNQADYILKFEEKMAKKNGNIKSRRKSSHNRETTVQQSERESSKDSDQMEAENGVKSEEADVGVNNSEMNLGEPLSEPQQ